MGVIAGRDDGDHEGYYVGYELDREILECSRCRAEYRLRYTKDEEKNLPAHRLDALRSIENEHPDHSDKIPLI
jgi:DNA transposition AAA+ family ATPase